jgi:hypothetical protein
MALRLFSNTVYVILICFIATQTTAQSSYKDRGWTTAMYANCGLPKKVGKAKPVSWVKVDGNKKLLFSLQKGQVGPCSTGAMKRHGAAFWERVELRQKGFLKSGKVNEIQFETTFLAGFIGEREKFFQIHGWADGCSAYPPLMMEMHKGNLVVKSLRGVKPNAGKEWLSSDQGSHRSVQSQRVSVHSLYGKPQKFRIIFDYRKKMRGSLDVYLNDLHLVRSAIIEYAPCAKPHIKFGIYRPGGVSGNSSIAFDDLKISNR